jgi:biotin carboxyl carrier protein
MELQDSTRLVDPHQPHALTNRSGSLVVQDQKGRDRERYPIVYGARLKVKEGQHVEQGQVLVEWDPSPTARSTAPTR